MQNAEKTDLADELEACPDINHARIVPIEQRETEYIVPASLRFAILSALRSQDRLREALTLADEALCDHACHAGPDVPCIRPDYQCRLECGKRAADALIVVRQALKETQHDR